MVNHVKKKKEGKILPLVHSIIKKNCPYGQFFLFMFRLLSYE
jgi:hypothetical protein